MHGVLRDLGDGPGKQAAGTDGGLGVRGKERRSGAWARGGVRARQTGEGGPPDRDFCTEERRRGGCGGYEGDSDESLASGFGSARQRKGGEMGWGRRCGEGEGTMGV